MALLNVILVTFVTLMLVDHSPAELKASKESPHKESASTPREDIGNKVTIVGAGNVGTAVAFSLLTQYVTDEIVLIDRKVDKVKGEVDDLHHGSGFIKGPRITGGTDYKLSENSKLCIVTSGVAQAPGQDRLSLLQANLNVFRKVIPKLLEHNPDAVIIIVTNPVDIMTYITWKLANEFRPNEDNTFKIIGSGTNLDSSRLRFLISQDLNISPESVHGWVIGEHGDSSVTVWSEVYAGGVNLRSNPHIVEQMAKPVKIGGKNKEDWYTSIHNKMKDSAAYIINNKGFTSWAVGLSVANLAYSIIHDTRKIHPVSTMVKGQHGIEDEVFLSLPCVLGEDGVTHIMNQPLEENELKNLQNSAQTMLGEINKLKWNEKLPED